MNVRGMPESEPKYLRLKEAAGRVSLSYCTLYRLIKQGVGPKIIKMKYNERSILRVREDHLKEWIEKHVKEPGECLL